MIARFHYDDEILARMLRDQLRDNEGNVAEHVETCEQCQTRLETITQDGLSWEQAGKLLRDDSFDESIYSLSEGHGEGLEALAGRTFLQATDHPDSLGRFGRYEIMEFLGRGGMGIVMRGFDPALNRHSAIKVLAPELASSAAARRRFSREAKSAAAVVHPHVVPIQTVDEQDGLPYLVMPVVEGQSLQQRVDASGPLEIVEVVRIAAQIAEGLAAAHDRGLVHRDIKPANVLLENGVERVQITDFGLARAADDASMTRSGVIAGTPQYMSPEQAHGDEIDHRSDLFSLGSVMYFMLTGRSPFRADTTMGVLNRIGNDHPRRLRSINPTIPPWLAAIVDQLLEKNPAKRYASAETLATELQARLVELQDGTLAIAGGRTSLAPSWPPSRGWALLAVGAALLAVLAGLFLIETDQGTIRIETNDDVTVPIRIRQGDETVERLTVTSDGASARVRAGTYTIEIEGNDRSLEVKQNKAVVKANDVWIASIELVPAASGSNREEDEAAGMPGAPGMPGGSNREEDEAGQSAKDPTIIRNLALEDAKRGRYEQALEKTLWYWDNAVQIQPSLSAVRRSFLLSDWLQLGEVYPPALQKMRSVRDQLQQRIESADQVRVPSEDFADFAAINRALRDEGRTKAVYEKIKARDPEDARRLRPYVDISDISQPTVLQGAGADAIDLLVPNVPNPRSPRGETALAKTSEPFQGTWEFGACESEVWDAKLDQVRTWRWKIQENQITWTGPDEQEWKLSFSVDPAKSPKHIDFQFLTGPHRGVTSLGIYEFKRGGLWICLSDPAAKAERPSDFSFTGDGGRTLILLDRQPEMPPAAIRAIEGTWRFRVSQSEWWPVRTPSGLEAVGAWSWGVTGNKMSWTGPGLDGMKASFTLDVTKTPKQIDITILDGPHRGATSRGVYEFRRGSLWLCLSDPGANVRRPADFSFESSGERSLIILDRVKEDAEGEVPPNPPAADHDQ